MQTKINPAGQPIGVAGQLWDSMEGRDIVSAFNEGAAQIPFGVGIVAGSAEDGCKLPAALTDTPIGVNVWNANHVPAATLANGQVTGDLGATGLMQNAGLQSLRRGRILATVDPSVSTITPHSDRAFLRMVATGAGQAGMWGNAANASYFKDVTAVGVWRSKIKTARDGTTKVAVLEVDFSAKP
jgi:hypothetical protein